MTIKAEVRSELAFTGECRTYRLSVETGSFHAPNPEHMEGIAQMLVRSLASQCAADAERDRAALAADDDHTDGDAEPWLPPPPPGTTEADADDPPGSV